jgi:hypothetical protein
MRLFKLRGLPSASHSPPSSQVTSRQLQCIHGGIEMLVGSEAHRGDYTKDAHDQDEDQVTVVSARLVTSLVHALDANGGRRDCENAHQKNDK